MPASTLGALSFSTASSGSVGQLLVPAPAPCSGVPTRYSQPRPVPRCERAHGLDRLAAGDDDRHVRVDPDPLLQGRGAGQVGVELLLLDRGRRRRRRGRRPAASSRLDQVASSSARSAAGTSNGSTSYAETHSHVACTGSSASSTRSVASGALTRASATACSAAWAAASGGEVGRGREAPHAVDQDPHRQPGVGVVAAGRQPRVAQVHRRRAHPLDPQVGVAGAQLACPRRARRRPGAAGAGRRSRRRPCGGVLTGGKTYRSRRARACRSSAAPRRSSWARRASARG